jgi:transcriptional regulator with XRE-family HTH domain
MATESVTQVTAGNVRARAAKQGLSVHALAALSGIGYTALQRRMRGDVDFTVGDLISVAYALSVSPVELMPNQDGAP